MKLLREILFPLIAVIAALVVGGIVVLIIGESPVQTYRLMFGSAFSWPDGIGYTLFNATPLIFTGLAVAVAFRCGLLNIGAEGQLYVAAFAAAWVGMKFGAPDPVNTFVKPFVQLPMILLLPLCCVVAMAAGGIWGGIPGLLKAKFGSHEVINTIMLKLLFSRFSLVSLFTCCCGRRSGAMKFARPDRILRRLSTAASRSANRSFWRWPSPADWRAWLGSTKCSAIAIDITTGSQRTTDLSALP